MGQNRKPPISTWASGKRPFADLHSSFCAGLNMVQFRDLTVKQRCFMRHPLSQSPKHPSRGEAARAD